MEQLVGALNEGVSSSADIVQQSHRQKMAATQTPNIFVGSTLGLAARGGGTVSNAASCSTTSLAHTSTVASTPVIITNINSDQHNQNNCTQNQNFPEFSASNDRRSRNNSSSSSSYSTSSSCNDQHIQHSNTSCTQSATSSASCDDVANNFQLNTTNAGAPLNVDMPSSSISGAVATASTSVGTTTNHFANVESTVSNTDILDDTAGAVGGVGLSNRRPDPNNLFEGLHPMITAASTASTTSYMLQPSTSTSTNLLPPPDCPICLQSCIHPARLPCGHIFCFLCIKGVAYKNRRCAMCRREIPTEYLNHPNLINGINDIAMTKATEDGYQWFYEGRNGWWQYDDRTSQDLEDTFKKGEKSCTILVAGYVYTVDFELMIQQRQNEPTRCRRVKRDLATVPKKGVAGLRIEGNIVTTDIHFPIQQPNRVHMFPRSSFNFANHNNVGINNLGDLVAGGDLNFGRQQLFHRPAIAFGLPDNRDNVSTSSNDSIPTAELNFTSQLNGGHPQLYSRPRAFSLANHQHNPNGLVSSLAATDAAIRIATDIIDSTLASADDEYIEPSSPSQNFSAIDNLLNSDRLNVSQHVPSTATSCITMSPTGMRTASVTASTGIAGNIPPNELRRHYSHCRRRHSSTTTSMGEPNLNNIALNRNLGSSVSSISPLITPNLTNDAETAALVAAITNDRLRLEACENMLVRNRDNLASMFDRDFNDILEISVDNRQPRHISRATSTNDINVDNIALNRNVGSSTVSSGTQMVTPNLVNNIDVAATVPGLNADWQRLQVCENMLAPNCDNLSAVFERDNHNIMENPTNLINAAQRISDTNSVPVTTTGIHNNSINNTNININNRYTAEVDYIDEALNDFRSFTLNQMFESSDEEDNVESHNAALARANMITINNCDSNYSNHIGVSHRNVGTNHPDNGLNNDIETLPLVTRYRNVNEMPVYISPLTQMASQQNSRHHQHISAIPIPPQHQSDRQLPHPQHQPLYQACQHQLQHHFHHHQFHPTIPGHHYDINDLRPDHHDESDDEVVDIMNAQPYTRHYRF